MLRIDIEQDHRGEWRWHAVSEANGKIVADSGEGYTREEDAVRAAKHVRAFLGSAPIKRGPRAQRAILNRALSEFLVRNAPSARR